MVSEVVRHHLREAYLFQYKIDDMASRHVPTTVNIYNCLLSRYSQLSYVSFD